MNRRAFIAALGGAGALPMVAGAQPGPLPTIGFLSSRTPKQAEYLVAAIREGLKEVGYREGGNVAIEYRYAEGRYDRLPALASDLVRNQVAVIIAGGTPAPAIAATKTLPIVFTTGLDPVLYGLVSSLNHPGGNATGVTFYSGALGAKQMELLSEISPNTGAFGLLINPRSAGAETQIREAQSAARIMRRHLHVLDAATEPEIDKAFEALAKLTNPALIISVDPFFDSRPDQLVQLAARHAVPSAYYLREFVQAGGLMSYGASITDTYRQAGNYAGRILRGERPGELPIMLPTKFELAINVKTAKTLGLTVPSTLLYTADEVIE